MERELVVVRRRLNCVICDVVLEGRQQFFCSDACRKRHERLKAKGGVKEEAKRVVESVGVVAPSVAVAAESDDSLVMLRALRVRLAVEIDAVEHPKDLAVLAPKFIETICQIEQRSAPVEKKGSAVDELSRRRAERRGAGA